MFKSQLGSLVGRGGNDDGSQSPLISTMLDQFAIKAHLNELRCSSIVSYSIMYDSSRMLKLDVLV